MLFCYTWRPLPAFGIIAVLLTGAFCNAVTSVGPPATALGCHKRLYTYRVTQSDANGRECWDQVSVMSCWGRCDSNEISDWRFPYKRSHHPVCVHAGRTRSSVTLRNCHPMADASAARYDYLEPRECSCQACSSTDTSCEGPHRGLTVQDGQDGPGAALPLMELRGDDDGDVEY